ncbi:MAG: aspartate carbamoyltransferase regulatory subunit [Candidatus Bathyarchaeota archaeon]|nr:aspartate carbamoyltransferase regulatory subunit [Candidatus Bathyarchaeota archaeon]
MSSKMELHVKKIKNGTVIDHINQGYSLDVLSILNITGKEKHVVSVAMNVPSKDIGRKDIVKIEDWELKPRDVDKIALIAPHATINIIRNYNVVDKKKVNLPKILKGTIKCNNPSCISNSREPIESMFHVKDDISLSIRCHFCGRIMEKDDVLNQF